MNGITQNTDYKVQWTPELREAVDNRIIEYLLQGYSQQEAEEKALLELLDHTTFNYPEVTVTAQAPVLKQVVTESDWDPGYTKFMSGERYYADQDHKNYLDWQRNDYTRGIREATDKWGNAIGAGVEIASGFTPLWWVAPAVRTGLDLSEGDYKGAALNAGLAFAAPYAVGKVILYVTPYAKSAIIASKLNRLIRNTKLPQSLLNVTELHPHSRVKVGDIEINDPNLAYRQVGESVAREFPVTGRQVPTLAESEYSIERALKPTGIILGKAPFPNPMYAQGHLWYGLPQEGSTMTGLLTTNQPLLYANKSARLVLRKPIITSEDGLVTTAYDPSKGTIVGTRRIPLQGQLNSSNTTAYIYDPKYGYRIVNTLQPKTSLAFFERQPAKISKAEKAGVPKGMERTLVNNEEKILNNAKSFALKYGYEIPETVDAAKAMYKRHNNWFRTVLTDALYDNSKYGLAFTDPKLQTLPKTESAKILASRGYPAAYRSPGSYEPGIYLDDFVFASPSMAENAAYLGGDGVYTVMLQRPFSLRNPLDWHNAADYRPISKYIYEPLLVGLTLIGNAGPKYELKLATKHLIPVKIAQPTDKGTLLGEYLGNIEYKSGGSIKIKKKNKGKFTDYCGGKVTEECIRKGKHSSNPTTRKRANFAWVARHKFKHEEGGKLNYLNYFN